MKMQATDNKNKGYTIIETMVSVSVFLVVVVTGLGALLNANLLHEKTQDMRSITDNLSFIMEDISRNVRTGYQYRCRESSPLESFSTGSPESCANGWALIFKPEDYTLATPNQWAYKIETNPSVPGNPMSIWKSTNAQSASPTWFVLNPEEVILDSYSGFSVLGAEAPSAGNQQQPFVTIRISGKIFLKNTYTPFSMQTSVSQRAIDVQ